MKRTGFKGFSVQYSFELVGRLNEVFERGNFNNKVLCEIGCAVSETVINFRNAKTEDGYCWFGELEFGLFGERIAVLFPKISINKIDRSINVYSNRELPKNLVRGLLEKLTEKAEYALRSSKDFDPLPGLS